MKIRFKFIPMFILVILSSFLFVGCQSNNLSSNNYSFNVVETNQGNYQQPYYVEFNSPIFGRLEPDNYQKYSELDLELVVGNEVTLLDPNFYFPYAYTSRVAGEAYPATLIFENDMVRAAFYYSGTLPEQYDIFLIYEEERFKLN